MKTIVIILLLIPTCFFSQEMYQQEYSYLHKLNSDGRYLDSVECSQSVMVDFKRNVMMFVDEKTQKPSWFEIKDFYFSKTYFHLFGIVKNGNIETTIDVYIYKNYHILKCRYKDKSGFKLTTQIK